MGLPMLLLIAEWRFIRTGDRVYEVMARRWSKAVGVLFAVGAVSYITTRQDKPRRLAT
jgi:cytochrome d ubiquinol oxidase subunit I